MAGCQLDECFGKKSDVIVWFEAESSCEGSEISGGAGMIAGNLNFNMDWSSEKSWFKTEFYCVLRISCEVGMKSENFLWKKLNKVSKSDFLMLINSLDNDKQTNNISTV